MKAEPSTAHNLPRSLGVGVGGTHHPSLLTWQLETPLRGRGQSSLSRTHPRGPLFPRPPPSSQPWVRLMELRQLQQWGAGWGDNSWTEGSPSPCLGRVQPELERKREGASSRSPLPPSPALLVIQAAECPQIPPEQGCSAAVAHLGPGAGSPTLPGRVPCGPHHPPTWDWTGHPWYCR